MLDFLLSRRVVAPFLIVIIGTIIYLLIHKIITKTFNLKIDKMDDRKRLTILKLMDNIIKYMLLAIGIVMVLGEFGIDTKSLIASLGAVGVVVGLAFQDTLKDFFAGIFILLEDQYRVGDTVTISGFKGEVVSIGMKTTKIKAYTGEVKMVSNRNITEVINHSLEDSVAIVDVQVAYESDLDHVEQVLQDFCNELTKDIPDLTGDVTVAGIENLNEGGITYRITAPTKALAQYGVQRTIRKEVKKTLDDAHITIPYPQLVIHNE